jgi:hypothetical protein
MAEEYFEVDTTGLLIQERGAWAIFCGEKSTRNEDGSTIMHVHAPLLIMPNNGMWANQEEVMTKIARILNENAFEFFDSAKTSD